MILQEALQQAKLSKQQAQLQGINASTVTNASLSSISTRGEATPEQTEQQAHKPTQQQPTTSHRPLNVLILYPDDWRHDTIGAARTQPVLTPFLDQLAAKEGIRFIHNCVTTSICWVSRATLFTGQYAARHQSPTLKLGTFQTPERWKTTWPYLLQQSDAGYYVGHVGKWQYYAPKGFFEQSFNFSRIHEGRHWYGQTHASERAANDAIEFLRKRPVDRPFALTVAFYPPKAVGNGDTLENLQYMPTKESLLLYQNITLHEPVGDIWNDTTWSNGTGLPALPDQLYA